MNNEVTYTPKTRLIPVGKWPDFHCYPTISGLRFLILNASINGMTDHGVIKRVGRKILIDEAAFFRWVDAQPGNSTRPAQ